MEASCPARVSMLSEISYHTAARTDYRDRGLIVVPRFRTGKDEPIPLHTGLGISDVRMLHGLLSGRIVAAISFAKYQDCSERGKDPYEEACAMIKRQMSAPLSHDGSDIEVKVTVPRSGQPAYFDVNPKPGASPLLPAKLLSLSRNYPRIADKLFGDLCAWRSNKALIDHDETELLSTWTLGKWSLFACLPKDPDCRTSDTIIFAFNLSSTDKDRDNKIKAREYATQKIAKLLTFGVLKARNPKGNEVTIYPACVASDWKDKFERMFPGNPGSRLLLIDDVHPNAFGFDAAVGITDKDE